MSVVSMQQIDMIFSEATLPNSGEANGRPELSEERMKNARETITAIYNKQVLGDKSKDGTHILSEKRVNQANDTVLSLMERKINKHEELTKKISRAHNLMSNLGESVEIQKEAALKKCRIKYEGLCNSILSDSRTWITSKAFRLMVNLYKKRVDINAITLKYDTIINNAKKLV